MVNLEPAVKAIVAARATAPARRSLLVAISGIDGSGKGFVSARLEAALLKRGFRTALLNIDGWLRLPLERFSDSDQAEHFYRHAIRFDALFSDLVLPLRDHRARRVTMDVVEETATRPRPHTYNFENVDVILLEGIFLLKRRLCAHYDLSIWVDCSFATALERAVARAQEGLGRKDTIRAYRTIYFPAQEIHLSRDGPREAATMIIRNDCSSEQTTSSQSARAQTC